MKKIYTEIEKSVLSLYALLAAGAVLTMIPISLMPYAGLACLAVAFVACYIYRHRHKHNDFMVSHTTYLIRTQWWSVLILTLGIFFFVCILGFNGDLSPIYDLMERAERGLVPTESDVQAMQATFVQLNLSLIMIAAIVCLLPYPLFILYRVIQGVKGIKKEG